ncbi:MAG: GIY-YIG nuclease family protein [Proteobacteria bacterium]|nr:GIY-YIG nuclease family protein [Desulfobulbaceae bacterium]MBU4153558.1 GIY-YIG nuclease family protein [Pseudomonadota bacterium]
MSSRWWVYIVLCGDGTLYTGITTDLSRRLATHNSEKGGARYTRYRQPVKLVYTEPAASRSEAARREWQIKQMTAGHKWSLVGKCSVDRANCGGVG